MQKNFYKEVKEMQFVIDFKFKRIEFPTYDEAEEYARENGIRCDQIKVI